MKKKIKLVITVLISLLFGIGCSFFIYVNIYYHPSKEVLAYFENENIKKEGRLTTLTPSKDTKVGIVFFPGAKVDDRAYVGLLSKICDEGVLVISCDPPFNISFFGENLADKAISSHEEINEWYLMGHSLGGVVASDYASKNVDKVKGIIFLASYPRKDLSKTSLKVLSMLGSNDGVCNEKKWNKTKELLPSNTSYLIIPGGNHAGFGDYGNQRGDRKSSIGDS